MSESVVTENADLFRAVNERILDLGAPVFGFFDLICECPDGECTRVMRMTLEEYELLRGDPALHAVLPGHEQRVGPAEVVQRSERYVVVRATAAAEPGVAA